jgi:regulator of sirC expression with transglutaminase-like and TPR domain
LSPVEPIHCRRAAFELMAAQSDRLQTSAGLVASAVAIAMHEMPEVHPDSVGAQLDAIAGEIRGRYRGDSVHAALAHAHAVLFDERGFAGDSGDYYNPLNSYLPAVLERRRGLPITLCLLYKAVLERLGVAAHGLSAPGHFLAGVEVGESVMIVDVFDRGRVLTAREALQRVAQAAGTAAAARRNPMPVATHREWLLRMLRNLMGVFGTQKRPAEFAAMVELKALIDAVR